MKRTSRIPRPSPLTTGFSGTARENRERLHNIFHGGRKRPGRWLFVLSILFTLFCCLCPPLFLGFATKNLTAHLMRHIV